MKACLAIFALMLGAHAAQAQVPAAAPGAIAGTIRSSEGQPLGSAAVTIRLAGDSAVVAGALAAADGRFRIAGLPFGIYSVRISHVGHASVTVDEVVLTGTAPARDVGTVALAVAAVELEGVDAAAVRAPVVLEADRTVYNTREMAAVDGGSAADVLRNIDELEVDTNGNVAMRGNQSVAVHINGRPAPMRGDQLADFLRQMPGKSIARVEVMPNPSARHDPEGMGGIVNIVLRDDVQLGISGSLALNANSQGNRGTNARIAVQHGGFTFFGGGSGSVGDFRNSFFELRQNLVATPSTFYEQEGSDAQDNTMLFGDFSAEYKAGERTTIWANGYASTHGHDSQLAGQYGLYDVSNTYLDRFSRATVNDNGHSFVDVGIGLKHQIAPQRHELTVDLRRNTNNHFSNIESLKHLLMEDAASPDELTTSRSDEDFGTLTLRADYIRPWGAKGDLSAGLSLSARDTENGLYEEVFGNAISAEPAVIRANDFRHSEALRALYFTATQAFGDFRVQAGVRGEFAGTHFTLAESGSRFENDYNSIFPNVNLSYSIDEARTVRLGYSKRVGRPPIHFLSPNQPIIDPLTRFVGNPALGPNYTHTVNGDFSWIGTRGTLRIAPYFRKTVDNWDQIRTLDDDGVLTSTWENIASVQQIGTNFTLSKPASSAFSGSLNFSVFHNRNDATNIHADFDRSSLRWSAGSNLALKVTDALNMTGNVNYMSARDMPQGRIDAMINSSVGVRQYLFDRKALLNLFINDPFDVHRFRMESSDRRYVQLTRNTPKLRSANLSITYNFGRMPQQQSRRDTENTPGG